jgi:transcription antitermination factor NusG
LALTWGISINHNLLYGRSFTAYTDHKSLVSLNSNDPTKLSLFNNITSWMQTLSKYSFDIVYIQGDKNVIPDFLSRKEMKEVPPTFRKYEFQEDPIMTIELEDAFANLDIVTEELEQKQLLEKYHESHGHFGARHIVKLIHEKEKKHWTKIYPMAISHCKSCSKCAAFTVQTQGYHPLRMSNALQPFDVICCDVAHMTSIKGEHAYNYTLITVDIATRFVCLEPIQSLSSEDVSMAFCKIFTRMGFPKGIFTDNGVEFTNKKLMEIMKICNAKMEYSAPYHHRGNGLAEANVKIYSQTLKKMLEKENRESWHNYVPFIEFYMNNRVLDLTKSEPFTLMFGRRSHNAHLENDETLQPIPEKELKKRWDSMIKIIYPNINERVKRLNKITEKKFNESHKMVEFKEGNVVMMLKKEFADKNGKPNKWEPCYEGPIVLEKPVTTRGGVINYRGKFIKTGAYSRVAPALHLKPYAEQVTVLEKAREESTGDFKYKVQLDNGLELWLDKNTTGKDLIREFKELSELKKAEGRSKEQKIALNNKKYIALTKQMAALQAELDNVRKEQDLMIEE